MINLRKEIQQAYDAVQVSEDMTEKIKQELYQQDVQGFHEAQSELFVAEKMPRFSAFRQICFLVACIAVSIGIGFAMWHVLEKNTLRFNPASTATMPVTETITETETTEPVTEIIQD